MTKTIAALFADHPADHPAIGAPGRTWLSYGELRDLSASVARRINTLGISRGDRVAIVLPNGPEMATAFVTIAQVATAAPLNPSYRQDDYAFFLGDLEAKAIVVTDDYDGPAMAAAEDLGLTVIRLSADESDPAGNFQLSGSGVVEDRDTHTVEETDVALILHTSGTTSRPKIVPLLQSNVFTSTQSIVASLNLTPEDCCLNMMPLFHIHGLIAAVMASLAAGARICCTPGFNALQFYAQLEEIRPTWYTAVPTMHQAILSRAARNEDIIRASNLRFIRSSSASLPAPVWHELTETFGAPVIEAYGMTEATHQICSNPMPPRVQKPGSVGVEAGPVVQIASEVSDAIVDPQETGEIVISGPSVTPGYESNSRANAGNFFEALGKRWFRTGDQGAFDADGYLHLTGRLKEIINRGGEKISPLEVDAVLLDHPKIAQAVCFAVPHPKLGEDVAAAVVLSDETVLDEQEIREFASIRLAAFKVPAVVKIVDEIPKGATGKMQRIGMAEKLGLV